MAVGMQKISGTFFNDVQIDEADGTVNWASAEGTPTDLDAGSTEIIQVVTLEIKYTWENASATGDLVIHTTKANSIGEVDLDRTETLRFTNPGDTDEHDGITLTIYDVEHLDVGIENEDAAYHCDVTITYTGHKLTGVTAAA